MKVSLVIPTWNGMPVLHQVLAAIEQQPDIGAVEKIAIDSGSTDGTTDCLQSHGFTVHHIPQKKFNHGTTRDLAIDRTTGDIVILLTQDAIPADDQWLDKLTETYHSANVGAAYCRQIPREDCNPFIARRLREWSAGKNELVVQTLDDPKGFHELDPMERLRLCAFDNVASSVRRSCWEKNRFGHRRFGEDVAFAKRVILSGHAIIFQPASAVIHSHNRSPVDEGKRIYCDHQNLRELFDLHMIPTRRSYREAVAWGREEYGRIVSELNLPSDREKHLHDWAMGYAKWSALGMYLGANHERLAHGWKRPFMLAIDRWMHRGI